MHERMEDFLVADSPGSEHVTRPYAPSHKPGSDPYMVLEYGTGTTCGTGTTALTGTIVPTAGMWLTLGWGGSIITAPSPTATAGSVTLVVWSDQPTGTGCHPSMCTIAARFASSIGHG